MEKGKRRSKREETTKAWLRAFLEEATHGPQPQGQQEGPEAALGFASGELRLQSPKARWR